MHSTFLLAALEQAWLGRGYSAPNPAVGAVAVQDGSIIARAFHRGSGTPHAEQLLLAQLPANKLGITLYVTLEPCNHWGKTPPCVDAIVEHGIQKVVYAYRDPNPLVAMKDSFELLQRNGIEVVHYPMPEIDLFYQSYHHWMRTKTPWVTVKIAQTLDGKIAGENGTRRAISNELCSEFTHHQRRHTDVILTTARTIINDDPLLNARGPVDTVAKVVAILDRQLRVTSSAQVLNAARHCHIYHDADIPVTHPLPNCTYHAIPVAANQLDLTKVLHHLGSLGFHDVWVEAGGQLFHTLHRFKHVHRTHVYLALTFLGEDATPVCRYDDIFHEPHNVTWLAMGNNMIASLTWQEDACLQE